MFESSKTERSRGYGTPQEYEACLDMAYMSDDDEVDPLSIGIKDPEVKKAFCVNTTAQIKTQLSSLLGNRYNFMSWRAEKYLWTHSGCLNDESVVLIFCGAKAKLPEVAF